MVNDIKQYKYAITCTKSQLVHDIYIYIYMSCRSCDFVHVITCTIHVTT